jgi:hypothetical protein
VCQGFQNESEIFRHKYTYYLQLTSGFVNDTILPTDPPKPLNNAQIGGTFFFGGIPMADIITRAQMHFITEVKPLLFISSLNFFDRH